MSNNPTDSHTPPWDDSNERPSRREVVNRLLGALGLAAISGCQPASADPVPDIDDVRCVDTILGDSPVARNGDLCQMDHVALNGATCVIAKRCIRGADGGGGVFFWSQGIDDGGTFIVPKGKINESGMGWRRIYSGPFDVKWFGAAGDGRDDRLAIQNAIDAGEQRNLRLGGNQGALVYVPAGVYRVGDTLIGRKTVSIRGDGQTSLIYVDHDGAGLKFDFPVNKNTHAPVRVQDLAFQCGVASNKNAAIALVAAVWVTISKVFINGDPGNGFAFNMGIVLDQAETCRVEDCVILSPKQIGIWLVNGPDYSPGANVLFTNCITLSGNTIADPSGKLLFSIVDDGGAAHAIIDNDLEGGEVGIRVAGVGGLQIRGNDFEMHSKQSIQMADTVWWDSNPNRPDHGFVGPCSGYSICENVIQDQVQNQVAVFASGPGEIRSNVFAQAAAVANVNLAAKNTGFVTVRNNSKGVTGAYRQAPALVYTDVEGWMANRIEQAAETFVPLAATGSPMPQAIAPACMEGIYTGQRLLLSNEDGSARETVTVLDFNGGTFTAVVTQGKNANWIIRGLNDSLSGRWTPVLAGDGGTGMHSYQLQVGHYYKEKTFVHIKGKIVVSTRDGAMKGNVLIQGLPFNSYGLPNTESAITVATYSGITLAPGYTQVAGLVLPGGNSILLEKMGSGQSGAPVIAAELGNALTIAFAGAYYTVANNAYST